MPNTPVISVLMSVYNGMPYLPEAIDSIVAQTFDDWELIVNDNASTDGSLEYLRERSANHPRMRILSNDEGIGQAEGLNRCLAHAGGEWVARMDADDRSLPQRFERQIAFVRANPEVNTLGSFAYYINPQGKRFGRAMHDITSFDAYERYVISGEAIGIIHPSLLIRRRDVVDIGGFRADFELAEDIDILNRLAERGVVMVLPEFLFEYRLHGDSNLSQRIRFGAERRRWVEETMRCRREGFPEPTWEEYQDDFRARPLLQRFNRERGVQADIQTRRGRESLARGNKPAAYGRFAVAAALRPNYTAARFWGYTVSRRRPSPASRRLEAAGSGR